METEVIPQHVAVMAPCKCQQLINFSLIPAADEPIGQVMGCGGTLLCCPVGSHCQKAQLDGILGRNSLSGGEALAQGA